MRFVACARRVGAPGIASRRFSGLTPLNGARGGVVVVDSRPSSVESLLGVPRRKEGSATGSSKRSPRARARWYEIPDPYLELLRNNARACVDDASTVPAAPEISASSSSSERPSSGQDEKNVLDGSAELVSKRSFWRSVRHLAEERLREHGPDLKAWQRRSASWRESLWVEELNTLLELEQWRFTADEVQTVGEGLFCLDVTVLGDMLTTHLVDSGLRGIRVHISSVAGTVYHATVQPGSKAGSLLLSAPADLESETGPFEIEFKPHRFQQIAMHRALDALRTEDLLRSTVREPGSPAPPPIPPPPADSFAALPKTLNEGQRRAVAAALAWSSSSPLVLWGPPGTGKTTLASFAIWHLIQQRPTSLHILATAPSNTGADVLCSKLARLGLDAGRMLRLNALGRSVTTLPDELHKFCSFGRGEDGRQVFSVPPLDELRKFRVVVTTCVCAAHIANALRGEGAVHGWFSHVVVDEAGEATEPETLVPLSLLRSVGGVPILLGDHFQLGPLVISLLASKLGSLGTSMLERVVNDRFDLVQAEESEARDAGTLSRDALAASEDHGLFFLTESFRSHAAIMSMYSQIFYADQLEHRPRTRQDALLPFFRARGVEVPVLLHNVVGRESRERGAKSVANLDEVRVVQEYVLDLLADPQLGLSPEDVGVITPYTRQLQALEKQLSTLGSGLSGVQCGTVERFQGQERTVVIISTVRSSRTSEDDGDPERPQRRPLGFVADPKRLNVAISRAVAGLVIVGDLRTLATYSPHWRKLVERGQAMGVVTGDRLGRPEPRPAQVDPLRAQEEPPQAHVSAAKATAAWDALTDSA